jgi:gas vesicle protein
MNLVGKTFIALIMIMSVLFMGLAIALYATHTNWKDVASETNEQLQETRNRLTELENTRDRMQEQYEEQLRDKQDRLTQLSEKIDQLSAENADLLTNITSLKESEEGAVAAMQSAHDTLADLRTNVESLREEIRNVQEDRDQNFEELVDQTDTAQMLAQDLATIEARVKTLSADYADAVEVLKKHDLKAKPDLYTGVPPRVEGLITQVRPSGLVEINIGSDDGLMKGHPLHVYRIEDASSVYLGKIEVTETAPDKSVAKILPEFRKGTIKGGDRVASKLD